MASRSESRKKTLTIGVRATPLEKEMLKARAAAFSISVGELCRRAIFGSVPKSKTDQDAISELALTRADMGRMGGLLKGWLSGIFAQNAPTLKTHTEVVNLLREIEGAQVKVLEAAKKLVNKL